MEEGKFVPGGSNWMGFQDQKDISLTVACDLPHVHQGHDCYQFPQLKIEKCEICGKNTCGWTRAACVFGYGLKRAYTGCADCSSDPTKNEQWLEMIEKHTK